MPSKKVSIIISVIVLFLGIVILGNSVGNLQKIDKQQQVLDDQLKSLHIINNTMNNRAITPHQADSLLTKLQNSGANSSSITSDIESMKTKAIFTASAAKTDFRCLNGPVDGFIPTDKSGKGYWAQIYRELPQSECDRDTSGMMYLRPYTMDIERAHALEDASGKVYYTEFRLLNGTILSFGEKEMQ